MQSRSHLSTAAASQPACPQWAVTPDTGVPSWLLSWKTHLRLPGAASMPQCPLHLQRGAQTPIHLLTAFWGNRRTKQRIPGVQDQPRGKEDALPAHSRLQTAGSSRLSQLLSAVLGKVPVCPELSKTEATSILIIPTTCSTMQSYSRLLAEIRIKGK